VYKKLHHPLLGGGEKEVILSPIIIWAKIISLNIGIILFFFEKSSAYIFNIYYN